MDPFCHLWRCSGRALRSDQPLTTTLQVLGPLPRLMGQQSRLPVAEQREAPTYRRGVGDRRAVDADGQPSGGTFTVIVGFQVAEVLPVMPVAVIAATESVRLD